MSNIQYDGSFEVGTSFTLRGNNNELNHFYEYVKLTGSSPKHHFNMRIHNCDVTALWNTLIDSIKVEAKDGITRKSNVEVSVTNSIEDWDKNRSLCEIVFLQGTGMSLYGYQSKGYLFIMTFAGSDEELAILERHLKVMNDTWVKSEDIPDSTFFMITHDGQSLDLIEYDVRKEKFAGFDLALQYNDDFLPVSEHIINTLNTKDGETGIALLHGVYGSGKTTYLRYLISVLKKRIIYMPPDMANQLGTPAFFNFIRNYSNSILIIEDAENILRSRDEAGTSPAISNLLNLSDGIMGDALNIQVVCTFNADIKEIDKALLRPGRLIANYYFTALKADRTKQLVKHLYGEEAEPKTPEMTIAEIYTMNEVQHNHGKPQETRRIGFV